MAAAGLLFVILTTAAMAMYHGSDYFQLGTTHYSFTANFLSDLGATRTYAGAPNTVSAALFVVAAVSIGVAVILSGLNSPVITAMRGQYAVPGRVSEYIGVASGVSFICIAAFPANVLQFWHKLAAVLAFVLLFAYLSILVLLEIGNGINSFCVAINIAYLALLLAYIILLVAGPGFETFEGFRMQVVGQKVIVYASIVNLMVQSLGIRRGLKRTGYKESAHRSSE